MSVSADDGAAQLRKMVDRAKTMQDHGYSNSEIASAMGITENYVRNLIPSEPEINWGYNCLTTGVHHGRPEALWNMPLLQMTYIFNPDEIKELIVYRIYTDALIYVHRGSDPRPTEQWAERIKEIAEERYLNVLQLKIGEITKYYESPAWHRDVHGVIERIKNNRLNPRYQPLHSHDSINMLCRIVGVSASIEASKDIAE